MEIKFEHILDVRFFGKKFFAVTFLTGNERFTMLYEDVERFIRDFNNKSILID